MKLSDEKAREAISIIEERIQMLNVIWQKHERRSFPITTEYLSCLLVHARRLHAFLEQYAEKGV